MLRSHKYAVAGFAVATLLAAGGVGTAFAREGITVRQDNVAMGEAQIKQLLPLMDKDKNGKVSEEAFMKYMQAEFKKLKKDESGVVDSKEGTRPLGEMTTFSAAGK